MSIRNRLFIVHGKRAREIYFVKFDSGGNCLLAQNTGAVVSPLAFRSNPPNLISHHEGRFDRFDSSGAAVFNVSVERYSGVRENRSSEKKLTRRGKKRAYG